MIPARLRIAGAMLASVVVLSLSGSGRAQSGAGYDLAWHAIDGGGGASAGAGFQLVGTIAQLEASGSANGGGFTLDGGFWPGAGLAPAAPTPMATGATPGTPTPSGFATVTATSSDFVTPTGTTTPAVTATPVALSTPTAIPTPSIEAASVRKCQAAIAKTSAAFVQAKLAALQQCQTKIVVGKLAGVCPDDDPKTTQKIADALQRVRDGIGKACGGKNKVCSDTDTGADADVLRTAIGFPAVCPGFEGSCSTAIADRDCGDIATCLGCIGGVAVDQAIALYDGVTPTDPKAAKALNACQRTIGKSAVKLFSARSKVLQSCWGQVSSGKIPGPCPDAAKAEPAIAKACCGKNKTCNLADDGVDGDFDPVTEIGFRTSCDSVTVPGGASCDGTITDMQSLRACLVCVTEFKTTCVSAASRPAVVRPYPAECE